jgi:hypothetical protein
MRPTEAQGAVTARAHWEVLTAVAILIFVLVVLDAESIRAPWLVLSLLPLVFLVRAALFPLTVEGAAAWSAALSGFGLTAHDARYAGLAYPAVVLALLLVVRDMLHGRRGARR